MDSDGTLAKVTYLPGAVPPGAVPPSAASPCAAAPAQDAAVAGERAPSVPSQGPPSVPPDESTRRAENISMSALTRRGRSRWELGEVLRSRDVNSAVAEAELDRLEQVGLVDDAALAETIVRTQHERKGLGRSALVNEMRRKHIDQDAIDAALGQLGDEAEFQRAVQLAERRVNQMRGLDHATAVRRLSGYLQRKGYNGDTVRRVILETLPRQSSGVSFS
ncbi:MAG: regulatory protein RecX [Terrimesophilobacter sp.]